MKPGFLLSKLKSSTIDHRPLPKLDYLNQNIVQCGLIALDTEQRPLVEAGGARWKVYVARMIGSLAVVTVDGVSYGELVSAQTQPEPLAEKSIETWRLQVLAG